MNQKVKEYITEVVRCELAKQGITDPNEIEIITHLIYLNLTEHVINIIENGTEQEKTMLAMLIHQMKSPAEA